MTISGSRPKRATLLLYLLNLLQVTVAENDKEGLSLWLGLVRYILAAFFVIFGLHLLLFSHLETLSLMKRYRDSGTSVPGDVLSCEPNGNQYQVSVLYTAPMNKYMDDPRQRFRHPNAIEYKRFLRRFEIDQPLARGSTVEVVILQGQPRSGCTREMVEKNIYNHSHLRTVLVLLPGLALVALILWLAVEYVQSMDDPTLGYIVLGVSLVVIIFVSRAFCGGRFEQEKQRRFNSAMSMKVKPGGQQSSMGKSEPLLSSGGIPVVMGKDVM